MLGCAGSEMLRKENSILGDCWCFLLSRPESSFLNKQLFYIALLITIALTKPLDKSRHPVSSINNWTNHLDQIIYLMNLLLPCKQPIRSLQWFGYAFFFFF